MSVLLKAVINGGGLWESAGNTQLGQVKDPPLKQWRDLETLQVPDVHDPVRWQACEGVREAFPDKFLLAHGLSIFTRFTEIRGFDNALMDICEAPAQVASLLDILTEMNVASIEGYARYGADGYMMADDWGLQNQLMIAPRKWRELWKPRYARIFKAAHDHAQLTFLHCCGYSIDILDDLIEVGLDAIHLDQHENMGVEVLGSRFGGRITFFATVDIQRTMAEGTLEDIRAYTHKMVRLLGRPNGGFIPRWYTDPVGAGHRPEAIDAMCEEFLRLSPSGDWLS